MKAAHSMPVLNSNSELERWILRVAYTTSIDHLRQHKRRIQRESHASPRNESDIADESLAELEHALTQLPPIDRELVLLRFARGFTLKQVGESLNTTPDAAHGRIRRIVASLRRLMQGMQL